MKFADVLGSREIKTMLIQGVVSDRIPHAQLITSRPGGGNLPMALAYAQYVLCLDKQEEDSCGACDSCRQMARLVHPDLHLIFPFAKVGDAGKKEISCKYFTDTFRKAVLSNPYQEPDDWFRYAGMDDKLAVINAYTVNEIVHHMQMKSYSGGYKICLIWMPELFFHAAIPKLLKVLEEPPPRTLFFLVSSRPDGIMATILSRTQLLKLPKIPDFDMMESLMNYQGMDLQRAQEIVNIADGNYNEAMWLCNEPDNSQSVNRFREWMLAIYRADLPALFTFSDDFHGFTMDEQKNFLVYVMHMFRESIILQAGDPKLSRTTSAERVFLEKFAKTVTPESVIEIRRLAEEALYFIDRQASAKMLMTALSLRIMPHYMRRGG
jgi:DNA polymerase-3 subunit delta'